MNLQVAGLDLSSGTASSSSSRKNSSQGRRGSGSKFCCMSIIILAPFSLSLSLIEVCLCYDFPASYIPPHLRGGSATQGGGGSGGGGSYDGPPPTNRGYYGEFLALLLT